MSYTKLEFHPLDTWFFREARPMETIGGTELTSVFPPSGRTIMGAIRTAVGDTNGADWSDYQRTLGCGKTLSELIGEPDSPCFRLNGPWIQLKGERLFPAPLFLMKSGLVRGSKCKLHRMRIGCAIRTSNGTVRLPEFAAGSDGIKPLGEMYLKSKDFETLLSGQVPDPDDLVDSAALFMNDSRLGIARDNSKRVAEDGMLYQTRHVRPSSACSVAVGVDIGPEHVLGGRVVRFGGEGRLAAILQSQTSSLELLPAAPVATSESIGLILILSTHACFEAGPRWLPPGFEANEDLGYTTWRGEINGQLLRLHSSVIDKPASEGGWDLQKRAPRAVRRLVPAGSAYYMTVEGDLKTAIQALHGYQIGSMTEYGLGQVLCGLWNKQENQNGEGVS